MRTRVFGLMLGLLCIGSLAAGQTQEPTAGVPRTVAFTGTVTDATGQPRVGPAAVMFAIYGEQEGGVPLWVEIQPVALDERGRFTVWLGAQSGGLPIDVFQTAAARWLGVQPEGQPEQPRVRFLSVPYALKAGDADTLGGYPLSAFRLAGGARKGTGSLPLGERVFAPRPVARLATGEEVAPDAVVGDDQIVQGNLCVGLVCANGETFNFDNIKLKGPNTRLTFEDTTSSPGFPTNDWQIVINDISSGGANYFAVEDLTAGTVPFMVRSGAPNNSLYVDPTGRLGVGTNTPGAKIDVQGSPTGVGIEVENFLELGRYAGYAVIQGYDRSAATTKPLWFEANKFYFTGGNVGVGTQTPATALDVQGSASGVGIEVENSLELGQHFGYALIQAYDRGAAATRPLWLEANKFYVTGGNVGIGTTAPTRPLEMASGAHVTLGGVWTNASSRTLKDQIQALSFEQASAALDGLQPMTYVYKADPTDPQVGFIAEDVPELVATNDRQSLAPMDIVAVLTKVVQEQRTFLQAQQQTIDAMSQRLAAVERELATARDAGVPAAVSTRPR